MTARSFLVVLALSLSSTASAADLTWKEANQRSAAALREGKTAEGADFARQAFELYESSPTYSTELHGQLLLNLLGAQERGYGASSALKEFEKGVRRIESKAAPDDPVLIQLWLEAAEASPPEKKSAAHEYFGKAARRAEQLWGPGDARTLDIKMRWVSDQRQFQGYKWARRTLSDARGSIAEEKAGTVPAIMLDLQLAKLEVEHSSPKRAIPLYRSAIGRLEALPSGGSTLLQSAYAHLEHAYEMTGDAQSAQDLRERRLADLGAQEAGELVSVLRPAPVYPRIAAQRRMEGSVTLELTVAPDGTVSDARVIESQPKDTFDQAALTAVKKWRYRPKIVDGQPVEQKGLQIIEFKLAK